MHIRKFVLGLLLAVAACDESPVSLPEAAGVQVAAASMSMAVGDQAPLAAQVVDQDGKVMQGQAVVYSTDNASVATVGADGMVRAIAPGTANITAANGSNSAAVKVTVTPDRRGELQSFEVMADSVLTDIRAGTQTVAVRAFNGYGAAVCPQVSLRTSDASVATARMAGDCRIEVVPAFAGEATITAEAGGRTDTFRVRVTSTGSIAFFSQRPTPAELEAGDTATYIIKVLNEAGLPVANQRVNMDVSAGSVPATVTTGSEGTATVRWILPTNLRELGQNQSISYRVPLSSGAIIARTESVFINGASLARVRLYHAPGWGNRNFTEVQDSVIRIAPWTDATLGASAVDQYGNTRITDFTFAITPTPSWWGCGGSNGTLDASGIEFTCIWTNAGTYTLTATPVGGNPTSVRLIVG